ncbi:Uncharacterised protein [Vibrio cholerae]|nr:Uncharacterised protein [Vibrio cholerae]
MRIAGKVNMLANVLNAPLLNDEGLRLGYLIPLHARLHGY